MEESEGGFWVLEMLCILTLVLLVWATRVCVCVCVESELNT